MAGLLSHLGMRDARTTTRATTAARTGRSSRSAAGRRCAKHPPKWVMAAELVETNRLWARTVAASSRSGPSASATTWPSVRTASRVGRAQRSSRHHRAGDVVRAADRGRPHRRLRPRRPPRRAGDVHPPRAGRGRLDHPPPLRRAQPEFFDQLRAREDRTRQRRLARRRRHVRVLRPRVSAPTWSPPATSTSGGRPLRRTDPELLTMTLEALLGAASDDDDRPSFPRRVAPGRPGLPAVVPVRPRRRRRRRHRPHPARGPEPGDEPTASTGRCRGSAPSWSRRW